MNSGGEPLEDSVVRNMIGNSKGGQS